MPSSSRRLPLLVVGALVLVLVAAVVLLVVDFDSPALGRRVLAGLGGDALAIDAEGFRLNLLRGLVLERVSIRGDLPAGRLVARADRLVLRHRLMPLLTGRIVLDSAVLERPRLALDTAAAAAAAGRGGGRGGARGAAGAAEDVPAEAGGRAVALEIRRVAVENGEVEMGPGAAVGDAAPGGPAADRDGDPGAGADVPATGFAAHGFDFELRDLETDPAVASLLAGVTAEGTIAAERVRLGALEAMDGSGRLQIAGGRVWIRDFGYTNENGEFVVGQLELDLSSDPFRYAFVLEGDPVHTHALLAAAEPGSLGAARVTLEARGAGTDLETLAGEGLFALAGGELPSHPVLEAIESVVEGADLVGRRYDGFEVPFTVEGDRIGLAPIDLEIDDARLRLGGWVDLDGPIELEVALRVPRRGIDVEEIPEEVLDSLTDADGLLLVPLEVRGSLTRPLVVPDRSALLAGAESGLRERVEREIEEELGEELGRGLRDLLGGDRDGEGP